jgi:hypothetical protein
MKRKAKSNSEIVLYQTEDGRTQLEVRLENETGSVGGEGEMS